ncbi:tetratricopeptide repeat protein [Granulicella sp. S190]|uniref:tetratricopeptide repeat protein n=1 Tax=Granulicella sp. S190 TaxID=1747226 RepID=UPI00131C10EB|nr:tetratricopeptide repeat protein [Granulicella sp. S190]
MRSLFKIVVLGCLPLSVALFRPLALAQTQTQSTPSGQSSSESVSSPDPASVDSSPTLTQLRAMVDRGHATDALKQLDVLAKQQPVAAGVNRVRGLALYSEGDFTDANIAFESALKQDPHDEESAQLRGLTLFRLGRPADAIPLLESASSWTSQTKIDPNYVLALCYLDTNRYDNARQAFATQYGFAPDSAPAYLLTARMLLRRDYLPVAQQFAAKALELDPQLPLAHALLGEVALAGEHLDSAIAEFEKERLRNPLDGSIYDRLGDAYSRAGDYTKAQQSLQRALLLEPNSTGPYILLGKVLIKRQDPASALMYLERAEKMDSNNYITHSLLGQAYRSLGRVDEASRETEISHKIQAASEPKLETLH